jgi:hypothetical protein
VLGCLLVVLAVGLWYRNKIAGAFFAILTAIFGLWGIHNTFYFPRPVYSLVFDLAFSLLFLVPLLLAWRSRLHHGDL